MLLWKPTSLTVEITILFNPFITGSNHYITSVNPFWSNVVMVDPTIDLCGKYPHENLFRWIQIYYTPFYHLYGWFASLWELPIDLVWPYLQSCKGWNSRIYQQFHRTRCYFWSRDWWLRKNHTRYKFSSPCKCENLDPCICNCCFEGFNIWLEDRSLCGALPVL